MILVQVTSKNHLYFRLTRGKVSKVNSFLRLATNTTDNGATPIFYADREVGALAIGLLNQETDIWTTTKAVQLLSSNDTQFATISSHHLKDIIANTAGVNIAIPVNDFLSDQTMKGLYTYKYKSKCSNLCTRTRLASQHLHMNIYFSDT